MTTGDSEKYCLHWNDFTSNLSSAFNELRDDEDFFDITLITEESEIRCHKLILGACSPHFRNIIRRLSSVQNPAIYLRGVRHEDIKNIIEFMYLGTVNVAQEDLDSFISVAQDLCVKGLTQDGHQIHQKQQTSTSSGYSTAASTPISYAPPPAKRAKIKSNDDSIIKSSEPKKELEMAHEIIEEVTPADQGDPLEDYEDFYEAGPLDSGEDGKYPLSTTNLNSIDNSEGKYSSTKIDQKYCMGLEDVTSILNLLMDPLVEVLEDIPKGNKENCQFILKNPNFERYKNKLRFKNPKDDKGPYFAPSYKNNIFELIDGVLKIIYPEELEFSIEFRKFIVPHTTTEAFVDKSRDLFVVRRVYVNQKDNTSFQKRYLYFLEAPERFSIVKTKMFVEFRGSDKQGEENVASM